MLCYLLHCLAWLQKVLINEGTFSEPEQAVFESMVHESDSHNECMPSSNFLHMQQLQADIKVKRTLACRSYGDAAVESRREGSVPLEFRSSGMTNVT